MTNDTLRFHVFTNGCGAPSRLGLRSLLMGATGLAIASTSGAAIAQEAEAPAAPEATVPAEETTEADAERLRRLGIVTVTARRKEESLQEAPVAITALTGESLDELAINDFMDISTQVPTMVDGRAACGSSASIFLRGVGSTALSAGFDQSVSFNIDGLPMSRGREISMPQYDIERVEVLKGPQALFYGKNTTGGLISVVSKDPTDEFEASGKLGYGFEAKEKYGEGVISGPLSDTLASHAKIHTADGEHYRDAIARAAKECGLPLAKVREREVWKTAAGKTNVPIEAFQARITALGKTLGPPWRADEKLATAAGCLALAAG